MRNNRVNVVVVGFFCLVVGMLISNPAISSEYFDLGHLTDVNITGIADEQVIKFNATDSIWYPANAGGAGGFTYTDWFNQQLNTTDDVQFDHITFGRFLFGNFCGTVDASGDPWYLSGTSLQLAENLIVDNNITADYYIGNGSQLTGISGIWNNNSGTAYYYNDVEVENNLTVSGTLGVGTDSPSAILDVEVASGGAATIGSSGCTATGDCAVAIGIDTTASARGSFAVGRDTTASGDYTFVAGCRTTASSRYSFACGYNSVASAHYSFVAGLNNIASHNGAFAIGSSSEACEDYAVAMCDHSTASGVCSFTGGKYMQPSSGDGTFVWGHSASSQIFAPANNRFLIFPQGDTGRVGIGTTAPNAELHVVGNATITNTVTIGNILYLTPLAVAPGAPAEGDIYYNSVNHKAYCYDGTVWQGMW